MPLDPLTVVTARINAAVERARAGDYDDAVARYARVFDPLDDGTHFAVPPKLRCEFASRRVDLLCKLGRIQDAARVLDEPEVQAAAQTDPMLELERLLQRGDCLAVDDEVQPALDSYSRALRWVDEQLGAAREQRAQVITRTLEGVRARGDAQLLLDTARDLVAWGKQGDDLMSAMAASWFIPYAYRGLGELKKAREMGELILSRARDAKHEPSIKEWEEFLVTLD